MSEQNLLTTSSGGATMPPETEITEPDFRAKPSRILEIVVASIALAFSGLAFYLSYNIDLRMDPGGINARWWPSLLSLCAAALSAILLITSLTVQQIDRGDVEESQSDGWARVIKALALTSLYVFAWAKIGYLLPTIVFIVALLWIFGLRSRTGLIAFPLVTTVFIYGLFHYMLRVPL